jgi:hypothetical protein
MAATQLVTFVYAGIYKADGEGDPLEGWPAYRQWTLEYNEAIEHLPNSVLGTRVVAVDHEEQRVVVQFVTDESVTRADLCGLLQVGLYDEGGLSGEYYMGRVALYRVVLEQRVLQTVTTYAETEQSARENVGGTIMSCVRV